MNWTEWIVNFAGMLLLTSLTGMIAQAIWYLLKRFLEKRGFLQLCYRGLWSVMLLYLVPVVYVIMVWGNHSWYTGWGGVLFVQTQLIINCSVVISVLWSGSTMAMGIFLLRDAVALHKLKGTLTACTPSEQELFHAVCRELQISPKRVRLYRNEQAAIPTFGGILHPMVLIPVGEYTEEQLRTVFLHELTHYKQKDSVFLLLSRMVKVVHFWNPMTWKLEQLAGKWSEYACDAKVYQKAGGIKEYYSVIVDLLQTACEDKGSLTANLIKNENEVKERILHMKKLEIAGKKKFVAAAIASAGLVLFSSLTAVAANGIGEGYQWLYYNTVEDAVEETEALSEMEEYTDNGPADDITVEEGTVSNTNGRSGVSILWTVSAKTLKKTPGFKLQEGQMVRINMNLDPRDKNVSVGIMDTNGKRRYVIGKDCINHDFSITTTGYYYVFVENGNSVSIEADGSYRIY